MTTKHNILGVWFRQNTYWLALLTAAIAVGLPCSYTLADQASDGARNRAACALPPRYSFYELTNALEWDEIGLPPEAVLAAHGRYLATIEALFPECVPYVHQFAYPSSGPEDSVRISEAEVSRLQAHQKRIAAASSAAEEQLFVELSEVPGITEADRTKLAALRKRRELDHFIEALQRRSRALAKYELMPNAYEMQFSNARELLRLPAEVRASITASQDALVAERTKAWKEAEPAYDAAIVGTLALQRHTEKAWPYTAVDLPRQIPDPVAVQKLMASELKCLRQITAQMPFETVERLRRIGWFASLMGAYDASRRGAMPQDCNGSITALAGALLARAELDDAARDRVRPILKDWMRQDAALVDKEADERIANIARHLNLTDRDGQIPPPPDRAKLAKAKMEELRTALQADWLKGGMKLRENRSADWTPTPQDIVDFALQPGRPPVDPGVPLRKSLDARFAMDSAMNMVPVRWQDFDCEELFQMLQLNDSQRIVADQLLADMRLAWDERVKPNIDTFRDNLKGDWQDATTKAVEWRGLRQAAWTAAREIESNFLSGLRHALGDTSPQGQQLLNTLELARLRDAATDGSTVLHKSKADFCVPNVVRVALEMRSTPEERALLVAAIGAQLADFKEVEKSIWTSTMEIQEGLEAADAEGRQNRKAGTGESAQLTKTYKELEQRRIAVIQRLMSTDRDLLARAGANLPDELAARWRRTLRLYPLDPWSPAPDTRLNLAYTVERLDPHRAAVVRDAFSAELDPWEKSAETIVDEIDRRTKADEWTVDTTWLSAPAWRSALKVAMLTGMHAERQNRALYRVRHTLPPEMTQRFSSLLDSSLFP